MTLADLHALDPAALWAALPYERQMAIIVPLLRSEFANVCAEDDGTDCSRGDQSVAARINQDGFQQAMEAIETAFPEILGDDFTALRDGPTPEMMDGQGKAAVKGLGGRRVLYGLGRGVSVRIGGRKVEIAGFKNLGTEDAPIWEAWLQRHVDNERVRRHPDQFVGPKMPCPVLGFRSVLDQQFRSVMPAVALGRSAPLQEIVA
ncbi:MAG: hypothetical protein ACRYGP_16815 [Janthinobacterium lividum]